MGVYIRVALQSWLKLVEKSAQKKKLFSSKWSHYETIRSGHDSQPFGLEWGPSNVVWQKDVFSLQRKLGQSLCRAIKVYQREYQALLLHFEDVLLRAADQKHGQLTSQLVHLLTDTSFMMNNSKRYIEIPADFEEINTRNTRVFMKYDALHRLVVRNCTV